MRDIIDEVARFVVVREEIKRRLEILGEGIALLCGYNIISIKTSVDDFSVTIEYLEDTQTRSYKYSLDGAEEKILDYRNILRNMKKNIEEMPKTEGPEENNA